MLVTSIPTVLILAQQWARRSRKGQGSVACTEQGSENGATRRKLVVRVSRIWLRVYFLEGEIQRGEKTSRCHTVAKVASRSVRRNCSEFVSTNLVDAPLMKRPMESKTSLSTTHSLHSVNMGSSKLVSGPDPPPI